MLRTLSVVSLILVTGVALDAQSASPPPPPTNLTANAVSTSDIDLAWMGSLTSGSYLLERSIEGATFVQIASIAAPTTSFSNTGLLDSTTYSYRVRARLGGVDSGYSNVASATTTGVDAWRMLGYNYGHTGQNSMEAGGLQPSLLWSVNLASGLLNPVAVENGKVFVTGGVPAERNLVHALSANTGAALWTQTIGTSWTGYPACARGKVFLTQVEPTGVGAMMALNAANGATLWSTPFNSQMVNYWSPIIVGNHLYANAGFSTTNSGLMGFNIPDGAVLFSNQSLEFYTEWSPAFQGGILYTFLTGKLRAHDQATGAVLWTVTVPWAGSEIQTSPVAGGSLLYVISPPNLYAISPATQSVVWSATGFDYTSTPAYADGVVYAVTHGTLQALEASTGQFLWSAPGDLQLRYPPVIANGNLYVSSNANVFAYPLANHLNLWSHAFGGPLSIADGKLFVARTDGFVDAYALAPGTLFSQSTPPQPPGSLMVNQTDSSRVELLWVASSNATGYRVERSTDGINFTLANIVGQAGISYRDVGLLPSTAYTYRVQAYNLAGSSGYAGPVSATTSAAGGLWPTYAQNVQHTGNNSGETGKPPLLNPWANVIVSGPLNPVSAEGARLFVTPADTTSTTTLFGVNLNGGNTIWQFDFPTSGLLSPPGVTDGRVFVQWENSPRMQILESYEAATGVFLWATPFLAHWTPTVSGTTGTVNGAMSIPQFNTSGGVASFDVTSGRNFWVTEFGMETKSTPALLGNALYSFVSYNFQAQDPATGNTLWAVAANGSNPPSDVFPVPALSSTHAYIVAAPNLYSINLSTHAIDASVTTATMSGTPALTPTSVLVLNGGKLQARKLSGLGLQWTFAGDGALKYPPVVAGNFAYVASASNLYAVNLTTHAQAAKVAGVGGWLTVAGGQLIVAGADGVLRGYQLSP